MTADPSWSAHERRVSWIISAIVVAIFVVIEAAYLSDCRDCEARGGQAVRGAFGGVECIESARRGGR